MGCCPNNVNPIPPTVPPVPPVNPPVPPDYEYPATFVNGVDKMILASESGIRLYKPEGNGSYYDDVVPASGTSWYEFIVPSEYASEYYLQFTFVDHAVAGSGDGTTSARAAWEQGNIELYRSTNPAYEFSSSADTDGTESADATISKGIKAYYKVINASDVQTGYRLDWSFADY